MFTKKSTLVDSLKNVPRRSRELRNKDDREERDTRHDDRYYDERREQHYHRASSRQKRNKYYSDEEEQASKNEDQKLNDLMNKLNIETPEEKQDDNSEQKQEEPSEQPQPVVHEEATVSTEDKPKQVIDVSPDKEEEESDRQESDRESRKYKTEKVDRTKRSRRRESPPRNKRSRDMRNRRNRDESESPDYKPKYRNRDDSESPVRRNRRRDDSESPVRRNRRRDDSESPVRRNRRRDDSESPVRRNRRRDISESPVRRKYDSEVERSESDQESDKSDNDSSPLLKLSKSTITRLAKISRVPSMASNVYEGVRALCGEFVVEVLETANKKTNGEPISFSVLEPILERRVGNEIPDLENTEIDIAVFTNFVKDISRELDIQIKKEAVLYLHNSTEYYLLRTLRRAVDMSKNARRSRVTLNDLVLAAGR